jgi:2'-5' RNA ligase
MRLFAAIPVPEPARSEIIEILKGLQSQSWPVRWVRPEALHLTVKFFGAVTEETAASLIPALGAAAEGIGPIPLCCNGIGSFPSGQLAKVIWMGIESPAALELLQDAVERACVPLGFPVEGRPFRPHLTLGRVKEGGKLPMNAFANMDRDSEVPFLADRLVLFQSKPGPGGSVYSARHTFELRPCAAV